MLAFMNAALNDFLTNMYFIQAIGFVAFGFGVGGFLQKDDRKFKIVLVIGCLFLAVHYFLLGAAAAAGTTLITAIRNSASLSKIGTIKWAAFPFITTYVVIGILQYEYWYDALPIAAPVVSTYALFHFKGVKMRAFFLFATSCWITHNFMVGSIGPFFMEVFIFSANAYTILTMAGIIKKRRKRA